VRPIELRSLGFSPLVIEHNFQPAPILTSSTYNTALPLLVVRGMKAGPPHEAAMLSARLGRTMSRRRDLFRRRLAFVGFPGPQRQRGSYHSKVVPGDVLVQVLHSLILQEEA